MALRRRCGVLGCMSHDSSVTALNFLREVRLSTGTCRMHSTLTRDSPHMLLGPPRAHSPARHDRHDWPGRDMPILQHGSAAVCWAHGIALGALSYGRGRQRSTRFRTKRGSGACLFRCPGRCWHAALASWAVRLLKCAWQRHGFDNTCAAVQPVERQHGSRARTAAMRPRLLPAAAAARAQRGGGLALKAAGPKREHINLGGLCNRAQGHPPLLAAPARHSQTLALNLQRS